MLAILLTTYNGEKYIHVQLDSILAQNYSSWELYIRDDGSSDNTVSICEEYEKKDSRVHFLDDSCKHRGPADGFMWLLQNINADYYMFCDQDDYWLNNKIQLSLERMKAEEAKCVEKSIIVYGDAKIVDAELKEMCPSWYDYMGKPTIKYDQKYFLIGNWALGCTIMINNNAKKIMFPYEKYSIMHDYWLALKVYANNGIMAFIDSPLMLYRQHANNTLGANKKTSIITKFKNLSFYYKRFKECWIMSHKVTGVNFFYFLYLKICSRFI